MAQKLEKIEIQQKKSVVKKKDQNFFSKNVQKIEKNRELAKKKVGVKSQRQKKSGVKSAK